MFVVLFFVSLVGYASCKDTDSSSEKTTNPEKYKYTITHSFRKIGRGDKLKLIYFVIPPSNDYQDISNYHISKGKLLKDNVTGEYYVLWDVSENMSTESGEWFEFSIEFDYLPKSSEYQTQKVDKFYPYDTTSNLYKDYTTNYYDIIVVDNLEMIQASRKIWNSSTDIYDYAKKCLDYINANFSYKNHPQQSITLSSSLKDRGGDCGNLAGLFITLCRIKKIPARFVVFKEHVWAEFYLEKYGWIPVDPTFGLFGKASSGYRSQIAWANHIYSNVIDASGQQILIKGNLVNMLHYALPTHESYECNIKISDSKKEP